MDSGYTVDLNKRMADLRDGTVMQSRQKPQGYWTRYHLPPISKCFANVGWPRAYKVIVSTTSTNIEISPHTSSNGGTSQQVDTAFGTYEWHNALVAILYHKRINTSLTVDRNSLALKNC
jgi:hypothetical protein